MIQNDAFPILEHDPDPEAIIDPHRLINKIDVPEHCVICFFAEVIQWLVDERGAQVIAKSKSEMGDHPLYEIDYNGMRLAFFHPGVGAPLAVALLEEMIAYGCRKFVACGGCGVLDKEIAVGHVMIPVAALRDEGTSYHYLSPAREVHMDPDVREVIEDVLKRRGMDYLCTKTWTTDAIYRETHSKATAYRAEGCLTVEMETAAFFASAQFRGVPFGQILYGGDAVLSSGWDGRLWQSRSEIRRELFWLSAEAVLML